MHDVNIANAKRRPWRWLFEVAAMARLFGLLRIIEPSAARQQLEIARPYAIQQRVTAQ
jgi:hypothetical protein